MHARQEVEETPDNVIGTLKVYDFDVYALLDMGDILTFVTPFLANRFNLCPEVYVEPFEVCTPVGKSIIVRRAHRNYPVSILYKIVPCDLVDLSMVNFDIIIGMN